MRFKPGPVYRIPRSRSLGRMEYNEDDARYFATFNEAKDRRRLEIQKALREIKAHKRWRHRHAS